MTQRVWLGTSVFLLALVTHLNSLGGDFHYDDLHSIVENYHVRSLAEIPGYFADPATFSSEPSMAMYRPVVMMTYALAYALAGYLAWQNKQIRTHKEWGLSVQLERVARNVHQ